MQTPSSVTVYLKICSQCTSSFKFLLVDVSHQLSNHMKQRAYFDHFYSALKLTDSVFEQHFSLFKQLLFIQHFSLFKQLLKFRKSQLLLSYKIFGASSNDLWNLVCFINDCPDFLLFHFLL